MKDPILEVKGIVKKFPGVIALNKVDVSCQKGTVHCIVGENGAGKSTLVKILTGIYQPDEGIILINGKNAFDYPEVFEEVAYVPQELQLFEHITIAENLLLPILRTKSVGSHLVSKRKLFQVASPILEKFHIRERCDITVSEIPPSSKQLLQIARALATEDREIVIFDEPTTSLTAEDTKLLFEVIKKLKEENKAVIYISHKLEEIFTIGDEVTILRDGKKVGYARVKEVDKSWIVKMMSGREIDDRAVFRPRKIGDTILEVENLTGPGFLNISFVLHQGEILGLYGLVGSGRSEIAQSIFGYRPLKEGKVKLNGKYVHFKNPHHAIKEGLFYLPEERKYQGIFPFLSVRHNIGVALGKKTLKKFFVSLQKERSITEEVIKTFSVKTPSVETQIQFLSGGNQQKVIVGRSVSYPFPPKVIIFDEPTKGIDVMAKREIYSIMKSLAEERQIGIILISSELEELLRCCNRILTIYNGKITGEFDPEKAEISEIIAATINVTVEKESNEIIGVSRV
ncbi:MAG: ribose transport system ATP-binding protein [Candidatus Atribacteria bacterium]|nr:ribose transport system ATP-binding protein [Candidatus Atribacteria bacterium]